MDLIREVTKMIDTEERSVAGRDPGRWVAQEGADAATEGDRWLLAAMETLRHVDLALRRPPPLAETGTGARGLSRHHFSQLHANLQLPQNKKFIKNLKNQSVCHSPIDKVFKNIDPLASPLPSDPPSHGSL